MPRVERNRMRVWDVYFDLVYDREPCFTKWYVFVKKVEKAFFRHVQYFKVISVKTRASGLGFAPKRCILNSQQRPVTFAHISTGSGSFLCQLPQEKYVITAPFHQFFDIFAALETLTVRNLQDCRASKALSESLFPLVKQYGFLERRGLQNNMFPRGIESSPEPWSIVFSYTLRSALAWFDAPDQYESNERLGVAFGACFREINLKILKETDLHARLFSGFDGKSIFVITLSNNGLKGNFFYRCS